MFRYIRNTLHAEKVPLASIAEKAGTPVYVYSRGQILENFRSFDSAFSSFPHLICFALKANSNLSVAKTLNQEGAGIDIVSAGELYRALKAGFPPKKIVFSGVGKSQEEMKYALGKNILMFNIESLEELSALNEVAGKMGKKAPISIRVNPEVSAGGHHHISTGTSENKFGIHRNHIFQAYEAARQLEHVEVVGIQAHIGSQITSVQPFVTLLKSLLGFADELSKRGVRIRYMDMGGGLGITYDNETPPSPRKLAAALLPLIRGRQFTLLFEPGRFLVGNAGVLLTRVVYRKNSGKKTFVIVDAAMNDLARPALYDAYHEIVPVEKSRRESKTVDIVGPVCESGDYLAKGRKIPFPEKGELLAIENAGAYGFVMSSQYNSRPRLAEVMVSGRHWQIVRKRETLQDLIHGEK